VTLGRALLTRAATTAATLLLATLLVVTLVAAAPGDALDLQPDPDAVRGALAAEWGLDRTALGRWTDTWTRLASFELGRSYVLRPGASVAELLVGPAPRTLLLVLGAAALATVGGVALALITAGRAAPARTLVQLASAAPIFLLGWGAVTAGNAITWWAVQRGLVDRPAWFALPDQPGAVRTGLAIVVLAVGSGALARVHAELEDALVRLRQAPFVDAARARGQPTWPLVLRGLVAPLASSVSDRVALLVGGAIVAEKVLLVRGAGALLWDAALLRDHEVAAALALLAASLVALTRLATDALCLWADPRRLRSARWA
jgi:peptide/nickel transport system permease protein